MPKNFLFTIFLDNSKALLKPYLNDRSVISNQEGNSLQLDVIFCNPDGKWDNSVVGGIVGTDYGS